MTGQDRPPIFPDCFNRRTLVCCYLTVGFLLFSNPAYPETQYPQTIKPWKPPASSQTLADLFYLPESHYQKVDAGPESARPGWLGITFMESGKGDGTDTVVIKVLRVVPGSPAESGGLRVGDLIVAINGKAVIGTPTEPVGLAFRRKIGKAGKGSMLSLKILREKKPVTLKIKLGGKNTTDLQTLARPRYQAPKNKSLLHHALQDGERVDDLTATLSELKTRASEVVSPLVGENTRNPYRLKTVNTALARPLELPQMSEEITQPLFKAVDGSSPDLVSVIGQARYRLDHTEQPVKKKAVTTLKTFSDYLARLVTAIALAQDEVNGALAPLTAEDRNFLRQAVSEWVAESQSNQKNNEPSLTEREDDTRRFLNTLLMPDQARLSQAAEQLAQAFDLASLIRIVQPGNFKVHSADGWIVREEKNLTRIQTPAGLVLVGGQQQNIYDEEAVLIIDTGGDDIYLNSAGGSASGRPVSVVIDLKGNDTYRASHMGAQGAGLFGVGALIDIAGDDRYHAKAVSQGASFLGVGMQVDLGGADVYECNAACQGAGLFGIGALVDTGGHDRYSLSIYGQGFGFVGGMGVLLDKAGNDHYQSGGEVSDSREERATQSMAQGFAIGIRPWDTLAGASGGIGVLADARGNDVYVADYFAQGASYWYALGILDDRAGYDTYFAGRYAQGAGVHFSAGLLNDLAGDDHFTAHFGVAQGCGHDFAVGYLLDHAGNDHYTSGVLAQGVGNANGLGVLSDQGGGDVYQIKREGQGRGAFDPLRDLGGFGFLFDTGEGTDNFFPDTPTDRMLWKTPWSLLADTD